MSKSILNLLTKTMAAKEFSLNYGGNRKGAGRPKKSYPQSYPQDEKKQENRKPNDPIIKGKTVHIVEGKFFIDDTMPDYKTFLVGLSDKEIEKLWKWIMDKYYGQHIPVSKIQKMIQNFNRNLKKGE